MIWIQANILVATIIIGLVTYLTAYRHRVIYAIDTAVLRLPRGNLADKYALDTSSINEKLKSGAYTILQIVERPDKDWEIIYGLIKRRKDNGN
jgi:hypothetical protein